MMNNKIYLNELSILKEDIQKLKRRREGVSAGNIYEETTVEKPKISKELLKNLDEEGDGIPLGVNIFELAEDIESVVCEIEKKAKGHPAITLVGAFVFGLVIGRFILRK